MKIEGCFYFAMGWARYLILFFIHRDIGSVFNINYSNGSFNLPFVLVHTYSFTSR